MNYGNLLHQLQTGGSISIIDEEKQTTASKIDELKNNIHRLNKFLAIPGEDVILESEYPDLAAISDMYQVELAKALDQIKTALEPLAAHYADVKKEYIVLRKMETK